MQNIESNGLRGKTMPPTEQHANVLTTLRSAVETIVERHGGVRAAARATGVDKSFISRLMRGHKTSPSAETLRRLGLRAVPLYKILPGENVPPNK